MSGFQLVPDATLRAELIFRHGASDQTLATVTSNVGAGSDAGRAGDIDTDVDVVAVPGAPGDFIVSRVTMIAGVNPYYEIITSLGVP